ncbi:MAG TPA: hypothetical protein DCE42_11945 [Myxococcales bacterium]|nr:hypothetical protein [Myxococcales bacterium]|tara:strand:+ start:4411 stop:5949 length:1539 start_codon:yes stop_codon:yes gene_type:complete
MWKWIIGLTFVSFVFLDAQGAHASATKNFFAAQKALDRGEVERALPMLKKAAKELSHWGIVHLELAKALMRADATSAEIAASLNKAMKLIPNNPRVYELAGKHWLEQGREQKALANFARAIKMGLPSPTPCLQATKLWLARGEVDKPLACLKTLYRKGQKKDVVDVWLARCYTKKGDIRTAATHWYRALPKHQKSVDVLQQALLFYITHIKAQHWRVRKDWKKQIKELRAQLLLIAPPKKKNTKSAPKPLSLAQTSSFFVWFLRDVFPWKLPRWQSGAELLAKGFKVLQQGEATRAMGLFRRAERYLPRWGIVQLGMAKAMQMNGMDTKDIAGAIKRAIVLDPKSPYVHEFAGLFWQGQGKTGRALFHYQKALVGKHPSANACLFATRLWMARGEGRKGLRCLRLLLARGERTSSVALLLARVSAQHALLKEAGEYWSQAVPYYKNAVPVLREALMFFAKFKSQQPQRVKVKWNQTIRVIQARLRKLVPNEPDRKLRPLLPSGEGRPLRRRS